MSDKNYEQLALFAVVDGADGAEYIYHTDSDITEIASIDVEMGQSSDPVRLTSIRRASGGSGVDSQGTPADAGC